MFIDPDGRSVDDHIYLNSSGDEIGRVVNDEPDRYFVETTSCDASGSECRDFIEVNSVETVKGDPKSQNPWNGSTVDLDTDKLDEKISAVTDKIESDVGGDVGGPSINYQKANLSPLVSTLLKIKDESQEGGSLDYVKDFKDGTIYNINGVHYNSHEGLNLLWGGSLDKLGIPKNVAVEAAQYYHKSAYKRDQKKGGGRYTRVGPVNEKNHDKAIRKGYEIF